MKDLKSYFSLSSEDKKAKLYADPDQKVKYNGLEPLSDEDPIVSTGRKKRKTMQICDDEVVPSKKVKRPKVKRPEKPVQSQNQEKYEEIDPLEYFGAKQIGNREKTHEPCFRESESILSDDDFSDLIPIFEPLQQKPIEENNGLANTSHAKNIHNNLSKKPEFSTDLAVLHSTTNKMDEIINLGGKIETNFKENTPNLTTDRHQTNYIVKNLKEMDIEMVNEPQIPQAKFENKSKTVYRQHLQIKAETLPKVDEKVYANVERELWVEKYKPKTVSEIIGQQGLKCPAVKLINWLKDWKQNRINKPKNFFAGKEDGSIYKSVLISGPPGIGKSTTARLACQELGFDIVELNASDSRNKSCLDTILSASLQSCRIGKSGKKSVVIMDEVDGMSGNEDRGGIQEIISFIKTTNIPIICICNDRMHQKIRSLSNHCFDLRFYRPRIDQIKIFLAKIIKLEAVNVDASTLDQIIHLSQNDIRSILNNLQMFLSNTQIGNKPIHLNLSSKDLNENIFETVRKVFKQMDPKDSIKQKSDMFFTDYSLVPLFIHENYLITQNASNPSKKLENIRRAAENMSMGDVIETKIRTNNNWSLLPTHALFSTVLPAERVAGSISGMISFPQILGKTSSANKSKNLIKELVHHSCLKCASTRLSFRLDYLPYYPSFLYIPMVKNDNSVPQVVSLMNNNDFVRQDWDNIMELSQWTSFKLPPIPTKTKSSFTRAVNKLDRILPYNITPVSKTKTSHNFDSSGDEDLEEDHVEMVKAVKKPPVGIQKKKNTRKAKT